MNAQLKKYLVNTTASEEIVYFNTCGINKYVHSPQTKNMNEFVLVEKTDSTLICFREIANKLFALEKVANTTEMKLMLSRLGINGFFNNK
jgi:hypothetical protein